MEWGALFFDNPSSSMIWMVVTTARPGAVVLRLKSKSMGQQWVPRDRQDVF